MRYIFNTIAINMENFDKNDAKKLNSKSSKFKESQTSSLLSLLIQKNSDKLDENTANKLINSWNIDILAKNLHKFEKLPNYIAKKLITNWCSESLAKNLSSFRWLDKNIAKAIIKDRYWYIKNNLISFNSLDNKIADILIEHKDYNELAHYIRSFDHLDNEILIALLVNCTKYSQILLHNRAVFYAWWESNEDLLYSLKRRWKITEYKKLKEFYDKIKFETIKENFESNNNFEEWFDIQDAKEAIKYEKWKYVIEFLDHFRWDYKELVNLLIEWRYIEELKNNISKLWWHDIDRYELVSQFSITNNYNVLIKNADNFEEEWITNIEIADEIIRNSDLEYRDAIKKLEDYSDDEDWEWINYNLDFYKIVKKSEKEEFISLIGYFKSDFFPLSSDKKLPLKLRNLVREKFWLNIFTRYKDLFE